MEEANVTESTDQQVKPAESEASSASETASPSGPSMVTDEEKTASIITYVLYGIGFFTALTFIAGVIWAYVKRGDATTDQAYDQCRWQIRTFWFSLLWGVVGAITSPFIIGYFVMLASVIWTIYRIFKGVSALTSGKLLYI